MNKESFNKGSFQFTILKKVEELFTNFLYAGPWEKSIDSEILTSIVQVLLRLTTIAVRCTDKISEKVKDQLLSIYNRFIERISDLSEKLQGFNKNKELTIYLKDFIGNISVQDKQIIEITNKLIDAIEQNFNK